MALSLKQNMILRGVLGACVLFLLMTPSVAELPRFKHPLNKSQQSLQFLVIGDWGRKGTNNQSFVANQVSFSIIFLFFFCITNSSFSFS